MTRSSEAERYKFQRSARMFLAWVAGEEDGAEAASVVEAGVGTVEDMGTVVEGGDSGDAEEEGAGEATTRTTEEAV
mgnify:FL=1